MFALSQLTQLKEQMKHQETYVVARFQKSRIIKISICETSFNENIGIRTWGKIDFLMTHCGYSFMEKMAA